MSEPEKIPDPELVACEICLAEVPPSEAQIEEANDYVLHFCGLECYAQWRERNEQAE